LNVSVFPNPHKGKFNLKVDFPETGIAQIQIIDLVGQVLEARTLSVKKGVSQIVTFTGKDQHILFYKVIINNKQLSGKVIGLH
jgi:hypothetical protein